VKRSLSAALAAGALGLALFAAPAAPERRPVLGQIDLPHNYYFREMYLPHVTSGPGAVAWMPDGQALVYSMQGGLWKQTIGSDAAVQLTAGPGYDFQPDVARDGRRVVFVRYRDDAMELMQLDLASGAITPLTKNGAVNVDPRWSPDGERIAWVSTAGTGHFHVFVAQATAEGLNGGAAWPERRSTTPRYYYSAFDHELSPAWSPDGKEILYVGNPEISYGTGSIFRRSIDRAAAPVLVRAEETAWRAHPDWAPDGKRVIYSSYAGRQWHQLWITPAAGGDALPLSFGDYDNTGARWSPDGKRLAFISNRAGTTQIWLQDVLGGAQRRLDIRHRTYRQPMGELLLHVVDADGKPAAARVAVLAADGRAYAPDDAWVHADDNFDRKRSAFETMYFHTPGDARVSLPAGAATVTVWHGLESRIEKLSVPIASGATREVTVKLEPLALPAGWSERWRSGDVHVHMNYVGTYRSTPERLVRQASAEDLDVVFNLIVNKEQRIPDIGYFSVKPDAASTNAVLISHGQEFHTSYAGHLGILGLSDHFLLPDFAAYSGTALASLVPTNAMVADLAHEQGALVGHVHPFDVVPDPEKDPVLTDSLPVEAALGKLDYYEVLGFSDPRASAAVWYRLLNCGFHPSAAGGTDAMTNYASLRGPVGLDRVYVMGADSATAADPAARVAAWLAGLKAGHTMATNGPLLGLTMDGQPPGATLALGSVREDVRYQGFLRSAVPIDHLELVQNGVVVRSLRLTGDRMSADFEGTLALEGTGWVLLRAWNDDANVYVLDAYPYATTNPVFYAAAGSVIHCGPDSDYLVKWIDRLEAAAQAHDGYNTAAEKDATLAEIRAARAKMLERR
jgi:Tol biopolymer transport system component